MMNGWLGPYALNTTDLYIPLPPAAQAYYTPSVTVADEEKQLEKRGYMRDPKTGRMERQSAVLARLNRRK